MNTPTSKLLPVWKDIGYLALATAGQTAAATTEFLQKSNGNVSTEHLLGIALAGFAATGAGVLTNRVGASIPQAIISNLAESDDLLKNGDWANLSGLATAELVRKFAKRDDVFEAESDLLRELGDSIIEEWQEISSVFGQIYDQLGKDEAMVWFHQSAKLDPEKRQALSTEEWTTILTAIGRKCGCLPSPELLHRLVDSLVEEYAQAVFRILKDSEIGGRAYRGLLLSTLSAIKRSTCEVLPEKIEELLNASQETLNSVGRIVPAIESCFAQLVAESPSEKRLLEHNRELKLQWEQTWALLSENGVALNRTNDQLAKVLSVQEKLLLGQKEISRQVADKKTGADTESKVVNTRGNLDNFHSHIAPRTLVPRSQLLRKLNKKLRRKMERRTPKSQTIAIYGLQGMGKTQLANAYVAKYKESEGYEVQWWIRANDLQTVISDFYDLGVAFGFAESKDKLEVAKRALAELNKRDRWILVFDNASSPEQIAGWLPNNSNGDVLITTLSPCWDRYATPFPIPPMTESQAIKVICGRAGMKDKAAAKEIAELLGYLPLALEVAGSYCSEVKKPLAEYAAMLNRVGLDAVAGRKPDDYSDCVAATWQSSFDAAISQTSGVVSVLGILALADADAFPVDLLSLLVDDEIELDQAVGAIRKLSLVSVDENRRISIHRLVQQAFIKQMSPENRKTAICNALSVFRNRPTGDFQADVKMLAGFGIVFPHVKSVVKFACEFWNELDELERSDRLLAEAGKMISFLLSELWNYLRSFGQYEESIEFAVSALQLNEDLLGKNDPTVAVNLINLASIYRATNDLDLAEPLMRRALQIDEDALGKDDPEVAIDLNNLASLLRDRGDHEEAVQLINRALVIDNDFGERQMRGLYLGTLTAILIADGRFKEAEPKLREALRINEQQFSEDNPWIARDRQALARLLLKTERKSEAVQEYHGAIRALSLFKQKTGRSYADANRTFEEFTALLQEMNFSPAEIQERIRSAENFEDVLGVD